MSDFDTSTPRLVAVKGLLDAYISLDMNNVEPFLSKNYQYQPFPETTNIPIEAKESHMQRFEELLAAVSKLETIYHEVIEASEKVVVHVTAVVSTTTGATLNYDSVVIFTLVEEDGKFKVLNCKEIGDADKRSAIFTGILKAAAEKAAAQ